jgi:AmmeMemoRadiSam system protein B/AmmeMemoRadiSam system protein A
MATSVLTSATVPEQQTAGAQPPKLRPAGVADAFYPGDPAALTAMMEAMLSDASPPNVEGEILAAVAPHAGYECSGPVAAWTYKALQGRRYARVVVIGPSHYEAFGFTSVYDGQGYVTPLGTIPVDTEFARELAAMNESIQVSDRGHAVTRQGAEHAVEVQLPWLQHVLGSFTLVPIVMGNQSYESSRALGVALAALIQGNAQRGPGSSEDGPVDTLIVASSDLSHYHAYKEAEEIDHQTLNALEAWDYLNMSRNFEARVWEACGGAPIVAAMIAAERMGANRARALDYANSGDVTGDRMGVVGYSADVFVRMKSGMAAEVPFSLCEDEERELLALAQNSVEHAVSSHSLYQPHATGDRALDQNRGAFVTLMEGGKLRGCVGYTSAAQPLYRTIRDTATLAALRDPRFPPVTQDELPNLRYEVSVLSPLQRVADTSRIEIGKHGLLVKSGHYEGLLLPQVPVEQHWDRTRFLQEVCLKAGLSPDCWNHNDTEIFCFSALVFGDHKPTAANHETGKANSRAGRPRPVSRAGRGA